MIRTEQEYKEAQRRLVQDQEFAARQRKALEEAGLTPEQIERAMAPTLSFHAQLEDEVKWYERAKAGDLGEIRGFTAVGRLLIALRIAKGISQRELARRLRVDESLVSRDETHEYHGITLDRAERIREALDAHIATRVLHPSEIEVFAGVA